MAFVVEDGTGLTTATAYISVAFADAYHSDRGNTDWSGVAAVKETKIISATEFLDLVFGPDFLGEKKLTEDDSAGPQALEWPRESVFDIRTGALVPDDAVPAAIQKATAELARVADELWPDEAPKVSRRVQRSGRLALETEFAGTQVDAPTIRKVKLLLEPLLGSAGGALPIHRR